MKLIYRASNGKDFESEQECRAYEEYLEAKHNPSYIMFANDGSVTTDISACIYVWLQSAHDAQIFIHENELVSCDTEGLENGDKGVFMWDEDADLWLPLEWEQLNAIKNVYLYIDNEKRGIVNG